MNEGSASVTCAGKVPDKDSDGNVKKDSNGNTVMTDCKQKYTVSVTVTVNMSVTNVKDP